MSQNRAGNGNARLSVVQNGDTEARVSRPPLRAPVRGTKLDGGKWVVERPLGTGGMGVVVLAKHAVLGHEVAIKILPTEVVEGLVTPEARERVKKALFKEARILANAQSRFVLRVWDYFEDHEGHCLVMQYMKEGDLSGLLDRQKRLPVHEVARYLTGLADGLTYLHDNGVIHRDIKPENILLEDVGGVLEPRIADAGVAALKRGNGLNITVTTTTDQAGIFGTPYYMSPEAVYEETDERSDVYSLGIVVYQMITGETPFCCPTVGEVLKKHREEPPPPITRSHPTFPLEVEQVVLRALEKLPDNRHQTPTVFARKFAEALEQSGYMKRSLSETCDVSADTVHASTPPAERPSSPSPTPQTAAIHLERRRRRTTPVRGNTIHPKPTSWWVIAPLAMGTLLLGGFGFWFISGPAPAAENVADSAVEAEQAAPVAQQEEPPVVPASPAVLVVPPPAPRPAPQVVSVRDSRLCTEFILGSRPRGPEVLAACRSYCAGMPRTDRLHIKAISRGYCR